MRKIVVITFGYPNYSTPTAFTFVKELVEQWRKMGEEIVVINPLTIGNYLKCKKHNSAREKFPLYNSYMALKAVPWLKRLGYFLSDNSFQKAVEKELNLLGSDNIILYSHFLNAGFIAGRLSIERQYRSFCAFGESRLWSTVGKNEMELRRVLNCVDGFISVSSENSKVLLDKKYTSESKILFAPNGVNLLDFCRKDKSLCREQLGFPQESKIGIFVGHFNERKGPLRVQTAVCDIPNLKMIYIGAGDQKPEGENILFCGRVSHEKMGTYLCAADFFILPTQAEGCCNAIIEAMACGLPIISSKGSFNDDILGSEYSIRIDPNNIDEIKQGVCTLISDEDKMLRMSEAAYVKSHDFDIENRARKILRFIC